MIKLEITENEFSLIMDALEDAYYIAKDSDNKKKRVQIIELEDKLLKTIANK